MHLETSRDGQLLKGLLVNLQLAGYLLLTREAWPFWLAMLRAKPALSDPLTPQRFELIAPCLPLPPPRCCSARRSSRAITGFELGDGLEHVPQHASGSVAAWGPQTGEALNSLWDAMRSGEDDMDATPGSSSCAGVYDGWGSQAAGGTGGDDLDVWSEVEGERCARLLTFPRMQALHTTLMQVRTAAAARWGVGCACALRARNRGAAGSSVRMFVAELL
jgi:hypothetical protein